MEQNSPWVRTIKWKSSARNERRMKKKTNKKPPPNNNPRWFFFGVVSGNGYWKTKGLSEIPYCSQKKNAQKAMLLERKILHDGKEGI